MSSDTSRTSCFRASARSRRCDRCRAASATGCCSRACSRSPANVLVLDEPTNDLDIETLELLEELVARVSGNRAAGQPRSRVPRPRRHQHAGVRGQMGAWSSTSAGTRTICDSRARRAQAAGRRAAEPRRSAGSHARHGALAAAQAHLQRAAASWRRCPIASRRSRRSRPA